MIAKRAFVNWIPYEKGGRRNPPTGEEPPVYWAAVKFSRDLDDEPPANGWALNVRLIELIDPFRWVSNVQFRVDDAPHELLCDGARFELYEGRKKVATGQVFEQ